MQIRVVCKAWKAAALETEAGEIVVDRQSRVNALEMAAAATPNLQKLSLGLVRVRVHPDNGTLASFRNLRSLSIDHGSQVRSLEWIYELRLLEVLSVSGYRGALALENIAVSLPRLKYLRLSPCRSLSGNISSMISLPLESLLLDHCSLVTGDLLDLSQMPKLKRMCVFVRGQKMIGVGRLAKSILLSKSSIFITGAAEDGGGAVWMNW